MSYIQGGVGEDGTGGDINIKGSNLLLSPLVGATVYMYPHT